MEPCSQCFLSDVLEIRVQTEWMSWSKQASGWKPLRSEQENRICVHAPITHQENSFQVIPRDDLLPQKTLSFHIFPFWKHIFKKLKSLLGMKMQLHAGWEWKTFDLKVPIMFAKYFVLLPATAWCTGLTGVLGDYQAIGSKEGER